MTDKEFMEGVRRWRMEMERTIHRWVSGKGGNDIPAEFLAFLLTEPRIVKLRNVALKAKWKE